MSMLPPFFLLKQIHNPNFSHAAPNEKAHHNEHASTPSRKGNNKRNNTERNMPRPSCPEDAKNDRISWHNKKISPEKKESLEKTKHPKQANRTQNDKAALACRKETRQRELQKQRRIKAIARANAIYHD